MISALEGLLLKVTGQSEWLTMLAHPVVIKMIVAVAD